jgi:hypothetical protein
MVSPENGSRAFYQGSEHRVIGAKGVANPVNAVDAVALDGNDVEAHPELCKAALAREEQRGCANDLSLFPIIDGFARRGKSAGLPQSYLDKRQALPVEHDQVDFAATTAKVPRNRAQAMRDQETIRQLLAALA